MYMINSVCLDIIYCVLEYLDKNDSFNLTLCDNIMAQYRFILYKKYHFYYDRITVNNLQTKSLIEKLSIKNMIYNPLVIIDINNYINLISLNIDCIIISNINALPKSLKILKIKSSLFNQLLDFLPNNLTELAIWGKKFNKSMDNLPVNLKKLNIRSNAFSQSLCKLPDIEHLSIRCCNYNQTLDFLPKTLKCFIYSCKELYQTIDCLPESLEEFHLDCLFLSKPLYYLPANIKLLSIDTILLQINLKDLPYKLESLLIKVQTLREQIHTLPDNLKYLKIKTCTILHNIKTPKKLDKLDIHTEFLPTNIRENIYKKRILNCNIVYEQFK